MTLSTPTMILLLYAALSLGAVIGLVIAAMLRASHD